MSFTLVPVSQVVTITGWLCLNRKLLEFLVLRVNDGASRTARRERDNVFSHDGRGEAANIVRHKICIRDGQELGGNGGTNSLTQWHDEKCISKG